MTIPEIEVVTIPEEEIAIPEEEIVANTSGTSNKMKAEVESIRVSVIKKLKIN